MLSAALTAAAGSPFLVFILTKVAPALLLAFVQGLNQRQATEQAHTDAVDSGQKTVLTKTAQENADAERRASDAMVNTGDLDDLVAGLSGGKF